MYSALQGGLLTTEPPGKSLVLFFNENSGRYRNLELKKKKAPMILDSPVTILMYLSGKICFLCWYFVFSQQLFVNIYRACVSRDTSIVYRITLFYPHPQAYKLDILFYKWKLKFRDVQEKPYTTQ